MTSLSLANFQNQCYQISNLIVHCFQPPITWILTGHNLHPYLSMKDSSIPSISGVEVFQNVSHELFFEVPMPDGHLILECRIPANRVMQKNHEDRNRLDSTNPLNQYFALFLIWEIYLVPQSKGLP